MSRVPLKPLPEYIKDYLNQLNFAGLTFKKMAKMIGLNANNFYKNIRGNVPPIKSNRQKIMKFYYESKSHHLLTSLKHPVGITRDGKLLKNVTTKQCTDLAKRKFQSQVKKYLKRLDLVKNLRGISAGVKNGGIVKIHTGCLVNKPH